MRIYSSCLEAVKEIERDLYEMGVTYQSYSFQNKFVENNKDYETKELMGYSYCLTGWDDLLDTKLFKFFNLDEDISRRWIYQEALERFDLQHIHNPGISYTYREEVWKPFLVGKGKNLKFHYTYSERLFQQINRAIEELKEKKYSRQVVLEVYQSILDMNSWGGIKRVPCSLEYHFLRRPTEKGDKLNLIYYMRSCDFYTHFIFDMIMGIKLLEFMSEKIEVPRGNFIHIISSLHTFYKDYEKRGIF